MTDKRRATVLAVFGTRPEAIKLFPVLRELERRGSAYRVITAITSQHTDLLRPFLDLFGLAVDYDLRSMQAGQSLNQLMSRILASIDPVIEAEQPDVVMVQGDTTSALAGALAAFYRRCPAAHVEAGLRSGNPDHPFPEEANRRLITHLTRYHFAPTPHNVRLLLQEGIDPTTVVETGNPVVDTVHWVLEAQKPAKAVVELVEKVRGQKLIVLTTHRRENVGTTMLGHLAAIRRFVEAHQELALVFPVHSNPNVQSAAAEMLSGHPRIHLIEPLDYANFIHLMAAAWLVVSDSGGVQEEVPSLGKPLLVLRQVTERPEVVSCGVARLVGDSAERLSAMLDETLAPNSWINRVSKVVNPFGAGDSAVRIVDALTAFLVRAGMDYLPELEGLRDEAHA